MYLGISQLRERLRSRGTDSEKDKHKIEEVSGGNGVSKKFDYVMINEDLDLAKIELQKTINKIKKGATRDLKQYHLEILKKKQKICMRLFLQCRTGKTRTSRKNGNSNS